MPILAFIYAVFLTLAIIASCYFNVQDREPVWRIGIALALGFAMLLLYVGYWAQHLVRPLGLLVPCLFVSSLLWTFYHAWILLPKTDLPGLANNAKRAHRTKVLIVTVLLNFPAYWFGGISAWRALP
jgi:hypothetical protein